MNLVKLLCLSVSSVSYALTVLPPPSSKTTSPKKDKIKDEEGMIRIGLIRVFPVLGVACNVLQTAVYIFLMVRADSVHFRDVPVIQQLQELKTWHILATTLAISGCALRRWSFATLDRFFTYQLTIRSGHKLVQNGPYKQLRHPSYTGAILNFVGADSLLMYQGLWDVTFFYLTRLASWSAVYLEQAEHLPSMIHVATAPILKSFIKTGSILGIHPVIWVVVSFAMMTLVIMRRVENEEAMLKEHFGREWDVYASKRWRFIPYVY
ncbi:hypothetical protein BGX28_007950 [Mortierella sp. GBA30]|nr:hypothetical protein BGX28_007950 [Mortierella sp. GBA30]